MPNQIANLASDDSVDNELEEVEYDF